MIRLFSRFSLIIFCMKPPINNQIVATITVPTHHLNENTKLYPIKIDENNKIGANKISGSSNAFFEMKMRCEGM